MRVHVLGCSGAIARGCRTTSFLLDGDVLIDAGTGVGDLDLEQMACIDHVLLTHSHLDHVASLPLMLDAVASRRIAQGKGPVQVHALPETIAALKAHVFNDTIWPDFAVIPHADAPLLRFVTFAVGQTLTVAGTTSLNASAMRAEKLVADVQSLTSDPELRASLKDTLENVRIASDSAPKLATNMEQMTANGVVISE